MKYIYNITVNFKKEFLNFYEWNNTDKLTILKKVKAYKIDNKSYYDVLKYNIITEYKNETIILCNDFDSICIKFDSEGNSILRSKLSIDEEISVLEIMYKEKNTKIEYSLLNEVEYSYYSREEKYKIDTINNFLNNNKNNEEVISYLSYEWFNKEVKNHNKFFESVENAEASDLNKLYETIKLIEINV